MLLSIISLASIALIPESVDVIPVRDLEAKETINVSVPSGKNVYVSPHGSKHSPLRTGDIRIYSYDESSDFLFTTYQKVEYLYMSQIGNNISKLLYADHFNCKLDAYVNSKILRFVRNDYRSECDFRLFVDFTGNDSYFTSTETPPSSMGGSIAVTCVLYVLNAGILLLLSYLFGSSCVSASDRLDESKLFPEEGLIEMRKKEEKPITENNVEDNEEDVEDNKEAPVMNVPNEV